MRNSLVQFPHPLLAEDSNDIIDSSFIFDVTGCDDNGKNIKLKLKCILNCEGLKKLYDEGKVKAVARFTCYRTSYRKFYPVDINLETEVIVPKGVISEVFEIEPWIVAKEDIASYKLNEFNQAYFGTLPFKIKKGNALATAEGVRIKLESIVEKNIRGIVNVTYDANNPTFHINFAKNDDDDPVLTDFITIFLSEEEYNVYYKLRNDRYQKQGIDAYLLSSVVVPAITEGISKLREEIIYASDEEGYEYKNTVWAESILAALKDKGKDLEHCTESSFELANLLFSNILGNSLQELHQKMTEWNNLPTNMEDEL